MIRRQVVIPASPDRVWEALTDPESLRGWFGGEFDWELTEGSQLGFRGESGDERRGRVEEVRPERRLRFVWWPAGTPGEAGEASDAGEASEVSCTLEPVDEGVRLTVQERPVPDTSAATSGPTARARAGGLASRHEAPGWTAWDTRLAGAWAGIAEVGRARA